MTWSITIKSQILSTVDTTTTTTTTTHTKHCPVRLFYSITTLST